MDITEACNALRTKLEIMGIEAKLECNATVLSVDGSAAFIPVVLTVTENDVEVYGPNTGRLVK